MKKKVMSQLQSIVIMPCKQKPLLVAGDRDAQVGRKSKPEFTAGGLCLMWLICARSLDLNDHTVLAAWQEKLKLELQGVFLQETASAV